MEAYKGRVQKKAWIFPYFPKPHLPSMEKNKINMIKKSLSNNKHFGNKLFFPIEKVQNTKKNFKIWQM